MPSRKCSNTWGKSPFFWEKRITQWRSTLHHHSRPAHSINADPFSYFEKNLVLHPDRSSGAMKDNNEAEGRGLGSPRSPSLKPQQPLHIKTESRGLGSPVSPSSNQQQPLHNRTRNRGLGFSVTRQQPLPNQHSDNPCMGATERLPHTTATDLRLPREAAGVLGLNASLHQHLNLQAAKTFIITADLLPQRSRQSGLENAVRRRSVIRDDDLSTPQEADDVLGRVDHIGHWYPEPRVASNRQHSCDRRTSTTELLPTAAADDQPLPREAVDVLSTSTATYWHSESGVVNPHEAAPDNPPVGATKGSLDHADNTSLQHDDTISSYVTCVCTSAVHPWPKSEPRLPSYHPQAGANTATITSNAADSPPPPEFVAEATREEVASHHINHQDGLALDDPQAGANATTVAIPAADSPPPPELVAEAVREEVAHHQIAHLDSQKPVQASRPSTAAAIDQQGSSSNSSVHR